MAWFIRQASNRIACNIDAIFAQSQGEMLNLMKTKQVDFTFPFQANHKIDDDGLPNVTLIPAFVSFGSSLIANCEVESEEQLLLPCWAEKQLLADNRLIKG